MDQDQEFTCWMRRAATKLKLPAQALEDLSKSLRQINENDQTADNRVAKAQIHLEMSDVLVEEGNLDGRSTGDGALWHYQQAMKLLDGDDGANEKIG